MEVGTQDFWFNMVSKNLTLPELSWLAHVLCMKKSDGSITCDVVLFCIGLDWIGLNWNERYVS